jgi:signal transduction histidine kinase
MNRFFQKIRFLGVDTQVSRADNKITILLNEIIMSLLLLQSLVYIEFFLQGEWRPMLIIFVVQLLTLVPLILSYFNKSKAAKWYFNLVYPFFMAGLIMTHGAELRADFSFLILAVTAILFFKKTFHRLLLFGVIIFCYFFSIYYNNHYPAIFGDNVSSWNSSIIFIAMMACVAIIVGRFTKESEDYERKLSTLLEDLREEQEKVELRNTELARANEDLDKFASMASHDLKSPLRNISSFIQLINRKIKKYDDPDLKEYLEFVRVSANQMSQLIEDILQYSKVDSYLKDTKPVALEDVILKAKNNLRSSIASKKALIDHDNLPVVKGYSSQLVLLFQNLIENGLKYNTNDIPSVKITYKETPATHEISFKDNGIGISDEYFSHVFEMFKRLHSSSEYEGSGVGLAICKKIVDAHAGTIRIESELEKGTTFHISLPKTV